MSKANDLTPIAMQGYNAPTTACWNGRSPYLATSNHDSAWHIGWWLKRTSRSAPRDVRASRGDTYHVNGMKVRMNWIQGCTEIERIA